MDRTALILAGSIGVIAQLAMIVAGHYAPLIRDKGFMVGGLLISLLAGLLYVRLAASVGWPSALIDGGLAGGVCAAVGIAASVGIGDTPLSVLALGTLSSVVTGLVGGAVGKLLG